MKGLVLVGVATKGEERAIRRVALMISGLRDYRKEHPELEDPEAFLRASLDPMTSAVYLQTGNSSNRGPGRQDGEGRKANRDLQPSDTQGEETIGRDLVIFPKDATNEEILAILSEVAKSRKKKAIPTPRRVEGPVAVAVALLVRDRKVLMVRRTTGPLEGQWEFPGGKVHAGERPEDALRRELEEELDWPVERFELFGVYSHVYALREGDVHYVLIAYTAAALPGALRENATLAGRTDVRDLEIVQGSRPIVDDLIRREII